MLFIFKGGTMKTKQSLISFVGLIAMQATSFNPAQAAESCSRVCIKWSGIIHYA
jgi:hypothetical protein